MVTRVTGAGFFIDGMHARNQQLPLCVYSVISPKISAQDLYTLLLGEEQPACLAQLLLACCSSLQTADDEKTAVEKTADETTAVEKAIFCEDNLTFLLSMVQTAVNDSVAAAALR